ncbi:MAG: response regulator [Cyanobacteria bacterium]|nr:response regulator [Cyanobacteriota bacterium]MDA0866044.1 response regulator [Cyanobacteriota bacterium]
MTRLRQILVNLLTNAVKFTPAGEIEVQVKSVSEVVSPNLEVQHTLQISIRDTGIGIPPDRMNRLFKPFSQVDASITRKYGGTGLGLVICKQLAEAMGGKLWVESEVEQGTTFFFTLQTESIEDSALDLSSNFSSALKGKKILIVDDNATNRQILNAQAETWGMQPTLVCSGKEALLELTQGGQFDIAILDMQMPEMDGLQLAQHINQLHHPINFPLVMLTSVTGMDIEHKAMAAGFSAYLQKPIKHLKLFNVLVDLFGGNRVSITRSTGEVSQIDADFGKQHPLRILLAEDNAVNQKLAIHLLDRIGYRIEVAGNGLEVLEALERQMFDVILMDIQMPEMDGMTASQYVRERYHPCPRIIAVTANAMTGDREKYLTSGMDDYLSKPIRIQDLAKILQETQPLAEKATPQGNAPFMQSSHDRHNRQAFVADTEPIHDSLSLRNNSQSEAAITTHSLAEGEAILASSSIDSTTLNDLLTTFGGDSESVIMITSLFLEDSPQLLQKLDHATHVFDLTQIGHVAHTLKSSSASVGALILSQHCAELERQSDAGTLTAEAGQRLAHAVITEFAQVKVSLQHHIDTQFSQL